MHCQLAVCPPLLDHDSERPSPTFSHPIVCIVNVLHHANLPPVPGIHAPVTRSSTHTKVKSTKHQRRLLTRPTSPQQ
jgi:hypothetical protein